jgi:K+-sensing histidine kinase KdpD
MNNQKMWDMMEEQKRLNAAFAHDLRTPLTVLRGYTDFLKSYLPEGKINEEKLLSTLTMMSDNLVRLEQFCNTMKEIHSFEDFEAHQIPVAYKELIEKVIQLVDAMNGTNGIELKASVFRKNDETTLFLDEAIVMEVLENLLSNAIRYAKKEVWVSVSMSEDETRLFLIVSDDGKGFCEQDLMMATKPYYSDNSGKKSNHFGIGLYICKLLCKKHGGIITLANRIQTGALVTAELSILDRKDE